MATIVLGAQWGDEGKGKLIDALLAENTTFQLCCRAAGGDNAGHTVVANGIKYDFHIIPSGLLAARCVSLIGSGCVVNVPSFFRELKKLQDGGLSTENRLFISDRAHIVFDLHQLADRLEESELGKAEIGTTKRGIGPTYSTKASRTGVRVGDIFNKEHLDSRLRNLKRIFEARYGKDALSSYDVEEEIGRFDGYRESLKEAVVDQLPLIQDAQQRGAPILVEGANACMLDIDAGTYPMVTSSNTGLGGVITGLSIAPRRIDSIIGVVKAYTTRVGSGPFPSEQSYDSPDSVGSILQSVGHEIGVTSGRKRRCGWFDLVVVKYSCAINHYDVINLTKLDVLDAFDEIKVAVAYKNASGEEYAQDRSWASIPSDLQELAQVEVVYETLEGWGGKKGGKTEGVKRWEDLPPAAQNYVQWIEEKLDHIKIKWIGTGPAREDLIIR